MPTGFEIWLFALLALAFDLVSFAFGTPPVWPIIHSTVFMRDTAGVPVYDVECHNGEYDNGTVFNLSGTFHCALFAINENGVRTSWDLLATDEKAEQTSDWFNRGRMTSGQLWGRRPAVASQNIG